MHINQRRLIGVAAVIVFMVAMLSIAGFAVKTGHGPAAGGHSCSMMTATGNGGCGGSMADMKCGSDKAVTGCGMKADCKSCCVDKASCKACCEKKGGCAKCCKANAECKSCCSNGECKDCCDKAGVCKCSADGKCVCGTDKAACANCKEGKCCKPAPAAAPTAKK